MVSNELSAIRELECVLRRSRVATENCILDACSQHHFDLGLFQHFKGLCFEFIGEVLGGEQLLPRVNKGHLCLGLEHLNLGGDLDTDSTCDKPVN